MQVLLILLAAFHGLLGAAPEVAAPIDPDAPEDRTNSMLDHVVTREEATQAALKFDVSKLGVSEEVGCGKCSLQERMYCVSNAVFSDHCCCDKHIEPMPFVPHKCYVDLPPATPCMPIAGNCAQYSRIFDCCCKHILQQKFPSRPVHNGWLSSLFSLMGFPEREPAGDPVPQRPLSSSQSYTSFYQQQQQQLLQQNGSLVLADDFPQFASSAADTSGGHNKLVSGAHAARGGLVALLATLPMLLLR